MNKYISRPHTIEAFQFTGKNKEYPQWFTDAVINNKASVTLGYKGAYYVTLYAAHNNYSSAIVGDWICINKQGTIFKLKKDEFNDCFSKMDDL